MGKKILITGAGGYIGSIMTYTFLQRGFEVIGLDNFSTGFRQPLELLKQQFGAIKFRYYDIDLTDDLSPIFEKETAINVAIHLAGYCSVNESIHNPEKYFTNNVNASQNLLHAILHAGIPYIVFSSTCAVYGEKQEKVTEKHPRVPTNPYGESKKMTEDMLFWYGKLHNLRYVILRYFNVCGASEDGLFGDSKKPSTHLVQNTVRAAMGIEPLFVTCPKVDTRDGTTIRDYVDVVDLVEAHIKAIDYLDKGGDNNSINISGGRGTSVLEIIRNVEKLTGKKISFTNGPARKGEYSNMTASYAKAKRLLNWKPERKLDKSITSLIAWYKTHSTGWDY